MGGTVAISIVLAVAIFMVLPYYISVFFQRFITSQTLLALLEGVIRLTIFIGYVAAISLMPDIKRVYMYHGAEHKCINCIEHGMVLNVENVRKSSKQHTLRNQLSDHCDDDQYPVLHGDPCGWDFIKDYKPDRADPGDCRCVL